MPDFDLDSLKKTWQEQPVQNKYDNNEILQMLNKKSRNYVKYIFWISVIEFLFFTSIGLFYVIQGKEFNSLLNVLEQLGAQKTQELESSLDHIYLALKIISLSVTAYFIYQFYQNYRKIKIEENLKVFIIKIIHFKKTVNAFILINIVLLIAFTGIFTIFIFYILNTQHIEVTDSSLIGFLVGIIVGAGLSVLLIWLYYKLVYGIIMRKLDKNLKQLKNMDIQEN